MLMLLLTEFAMSYTNQLETAKPLLFWCTAELGSPEDYDAIEVFYILLYFGL